MLSWTKDLDDLGISSDVDRLGSVFQDSFNFSVIRRQIGGNKSASIQVQLHVTDFIYEHDSESTLLVIYYADHDIPESADVLSSYG